VVDLMEQQRVHELWRSLKLLVLHDKHTQSEIWSPGLREPWALGLLHRLQTFRFAKFVLLHVTHTQSPAFADQAKLWT
jgi:hypothetical protein